MSVLFTVMLKKPPYLILGLDPGLENTGFGLLCIKDKHPRYEASGTISCKRTHSMSRRLAEYWQALGELLEKYQPDCCAIEDVFVGPNPKSALRLGMARGVLLAGLGAREMAVFTYSPKKVKQNIAGNGNATKQVLATMTYRHLGINGNLSHHATDALAIALCHFYEDQFTAKVKSSASFGVGRHL